MIIKNMIKTKKYKTKIFLWIISIISLIILINSMAIYFNVEKNVLNYVNDNNKKILYQMKYNINLVNSTIQNLCLTTYYNSDVNALMNFRGTESYDQMRIINKLDTSIVQTNSLIHSIYIYNNYKKTFYSTFKSFKFVDEDLNKLIKSTKTIPVLKPLARKIQAYQMGDQKVYDNVLTYFMYQLKDNNNNMDGAVILNIKMNWLYDNIKEINMVDEKKQDRVFILNYNGKFVDTGMPITSEDQKIQKEIKLKLLSSKQKDELTGNGSDFFTYKVNGKKYIITYIPVDIINWVLIKVQPYDSVFEQVNKLRTNILLITAVFFLIAFALAIYVSKGLYKPIDKLLVQFGFNKDDKEIEKDEFMYLEQMYKKSSDQLEKYSNEKISNDKIMKLYFLRKLMLESFAVTGEEIKLYKTEYKILLDFDKPFIVCMFKIDRYKQFVEKYNINEKGLIKAEIINVVDYALSTLYAYEIVDMKDDEIVVIYNIGSNVKEANTKFNELLAVLQNNVEDKFTISFSAAISTVVTDIRDLTKAYEEVLSNSKYRFVYGDKCIIGIDMIENRRVSKHIDLHFENIKNFTEQIRNSNIEVVENKFDVLLNELKTLEYNDMMLSLVYLTNSVKNLVYELNMTNKEPINISSILNSNEVFEIETVDEFHNRFIELLKEIVNREVAMGNKRYIMTVETIKEIIETNYQDVNLSTVGISNMIRISPSTISRIFKVHTSVSVLEYINTVRLNKAVEWMENSKLSIGEIMFKVGIENESYFYKIFKKKYGATPREFISQKSINGLKG